MKEKVAPGLMRILKAEGVPWLACYPTNHVNNTLGAEGEPILMRRKERYAVVRYGLGHDPYTYEVSDHSKGCMASMARAQGYYAEDVTSCRRLFL